MPQLWGCAGAVVGLLLGAWIRCGRGCRDFLTPRSPEVLQSETLTWAVRLRGWCGWLLVLWAGSRWFDEFEDWSGWIDGTMASAVEHAVVIPVLLCLGFVLLPLTAARGDRWPILRGLLEPGRTLGIAVLVVAIFVIAIQLAPRATARLEPSTGAEDGEAVLSLVMALLLGLAMMTLLGVMTAAMLWGVPAVLRHMFRARDAHPAYPALLTLGLALYSVTMGLLRAVETQWQSPFPLWVQLVFLLGGPLGIIATSLLELWMLRTHCGVRLRRAYWAHA